MVEVFKITPAITLLGTDLPEPGFRRFLGAYVCRGDKTAVIDVGPAAIIPNLVTGLKSIGIRPQEVDYIILTHVHLDHAGGVGAAVREMPNATVIAHSRGYQHLVDPANLWLASRNTLGELADRYGKIDPVPESRIVKAADHMIIDLSKRMKLEVYLTPGHSPHHISLFDRSDNILFTGDAAGICLDDVTRPATPPPFSLADELASLDRLIALKPYKLAYGHFGCYDNAVLRLEAMRRQIMDWYRIVSAAKKTFTTPEDILPLIRDADPALAHLDKLSPAEYASEQSSVVISIKGIMGKGG